MVNIVEEIRIPVQGTGLKVILTWRTGFEGGLVVPSLNYQGPIY